MVSPDLERKVVRLVAKTMRLLLHLGQVRAAADLDRAFFTTRKRSRSEQRRQQQHAQRKDAAAAADEASRLSLGDGLGLPRGRDHLAWMQAVALHLQQQEQRGGGGGGGASGSAPRPGEGSMEGQKRKVLRGVEALLAGAREHAGGPGPPSGAPRRRRESAAQARSATPPSDLLAFAARRMGAVQQLVRSAAASSPNPVDSPDRRGASFRDSGEEIRAWLHDVKRAECERGDEMVSMALLESGLARLEGALEGIERQARRGGASGRGGGGIGEGPLMLKVDGDIERLVRSLDTEPTSPRTVTPKQVRRHAHILALAVRFLLFRHRLAAPDRHAGSSSPSLGPVDPLLSASQLYAVLLKVPMPAVVTPELVAEVRTRQTSSLFRLLDAHLTAATAAPQQQRRRPCRLLCRRRIGA